MAGEELRAPDHLSREAQKWYAELVTEYGIDDSAGLLLLQVAMESFDRMRAAQAAIAQDGQTILDRWGQTKVHPLIAAERDARAQLMQALKALNLDVEPLRDGPGRPPGA